MKATTRPDAMGLFGKGHPAHATTSINVPNEQRVAPLGGRSVARPGAIASPSTARRRIQKRVAIKNTEESR